MTPVLAALGFPSMSNPRLPIAKESLGEFEPPPPSDECFIGFKVKLDLAAAMKEAAKSDQRSVSSWLRKIVQSHLEQRGTASPGVS